jgi:hypothetical protein
VGLDEALTDGEAQARPLVLGGEERIEDIVQVVGADSFARVLDLKLDELSPVVLDRFGAQHEQARGDNKTSVR